MNTRILAVDDEPGWLTFTKEDLGKTFEVETASDLKTTLAMLKHKSFDLVIASSSQMEVLQAITERFPEKRVIVATCQPTTREAIDTYRLGALDYFPKDFRSEVISRIIQEAIQKPLKTPA